MTAPDRALVDALRDRYVLERELGRGGMATVYLAHDLRHKRPVALKVLHPELAHDARPRALPARDRDRPPGSSIPHILTVHDSGEAAGQLWFTMPFVEGESLRGPACDREPQLPVEDALRIATDAARRARVRARARGHPPRHQARKPAPDERRHTLVADFGIARALSGGSDHLTETGMSVGTPTYMSPEQAAGDQHLDARTDVYSLGTVLYEMLAGEPPFTGATAQAVIAKRFSGEVPRVRHVRPNVPDSIEHAITQALAPVAADRFASAAEFARALQPGAGRAHHRADGSARDCHRRRASRQRRMPVAAMALGLGILIGLGVLFAWRRSHPDAEGMAARRRWPCSPSRTWATRPMPTSPTGWPMICARSCPRSGPRRHRPEQLERVPAHQEAAQQIARELGVDYLLTATVQWEKVAGWREPGPGDARSWWTCAPGMRRRPAGGSSSTPR